jgi:hypothetical protein
MWYTLCSWQLGSKGEVVEVLEKEKELIDLGDQTLGLSVIGP